MRQQRTVLTADHHVPCFNAAREGARHLSHDRRAVHHLVQQGHAVPSEHIPTGIRAEPGADRTERRSRQRGSQQPGRRTRSKDH